MTYDDQAGSCRISHCETVLCLGDDCQGGTIDTVSRLECTGTDGPCDNVAVSNIQDGGSVVCRGGDSCSDSTFSAAGGASYTHICDSSEQHGCGACEATGFDGLGNGGGGTLTLICGRGEGSCAALQFREISLDDNDDPRLCIICAFPGSCFRFQDDDGNVAFDDGYNQNATTFGGGCGPTDIARLCHFYQEYDILFFDLDGDGINDCQDQDQERHENGVGDGIILDGQQKDELPTTFGGEEILEEEQAAGDRDGDEVVS